MTQPLPTITGFSMRVEGVPVPKGRPRFSKLGHAYTDPKTRNYEKAVAAAWKEQQGVTLEGNVEIFVVVGTPNMNADIDNFCKSVLDGLQLGGAFANGDEQVTRLTAWKYPAGKDDAFTSVILRSVPELAKVEK